MRLQRLFVLTPLVFLLGIVPAFAQTQIILPELSGDYAVSQTHYDLTDSSREEIFTEDPNDKREIVLTVYYPANPAPDAETAPYMSDTLKQAVIQQLGLPDALLNVETHTSTDQPAAQGEFPLLIFSPGFGNLTAFYTSLLEDVASHGYIVAAIWHPYSTTMVGFDDGRVAVINQLGSDLSDENRPTIANVWTADALFSLNSLETLNQADPILAGHMDFEHVGAFGHSFGGATAAELAHDDARVDAAINMDGTMFGEVAQSGLTKPFMMMMSERLTPSADELAAAGLTPEQFKQSMADYDNSVSVALQNAHPGYQFLLKHSGHNTYTTDYLTAATAYPDFITADDEIGTVDHDQAFDLIRTYLVAFFDQEMMGKTSDLFANSTDNTQINLETFNAESA
jgi:predicted dienelactone hydrolase